MTSADETTATRNKEIVRRQFDSWNDGELDALGKDLGAEATNFRVPTDVDQLRRIVQNWRTAFPDLHYTVDTLLAEDDQVELSSAAGTIGIVPTGRPGHSATRSPRIPDGAKSTR